MSDPRAQKLFSRRFEALDSRPSRLAAAASGREDLLDLTCSNPTAVGLRFPEPEIRECLAAAAAERYEPAPLGIEPARAAAAHYYRRRGSNVGADSVWLAAGTSEAYALLFKLLADPGDAVLVPSPSYPLFDFLAMAENIAAVPYPIHDAGGWQLDVDALADAVTSATRAIVVVHPNNPTGHYLGEAEWTGVQEIAARNGLAVIADEVFFDFPLTGCQPLDLVGETAALTFLLNGLSKSAGLPQLKLAWSVALGPADLVGESLGRLELLADTFLSVATPVQHALGRLLELAPGIRESILQRTRSNWRRLEISQLECPAVEGGWSAPVRMPATDSGEQWALRWLEQFGVLTHPGELFGFGSPYLVVSLLTRPEVMEEALGRVPGSG